MTDQHTTDTELAAAAEGREIGIGHNEPPVEMLLKIEDLLRTFTRESTGKYLGLSADVADLLAEIGGRKEGVAGVPAKIETDSENGIVAGFMEKLRSTIKRVEDHRAAEKAPYLAATRGIDNHFGEYTSRLEKTRDILQARGNDYTRRKAAQERAERERVAQAERDRLAEIAAAAERARQAAAEREAAAARARKPENIEAHKEAAEQHTIAAATLQVDQMVAADRATEAQIATHAKTADMVRTKFSSGHMATGKEVGYVEITDIEQIDLNLLRPYFKQDHVLSALKAFAKFHKHKLPQALADKMAGAVIEMRDAADYR